jgi:hypothetical protein
MRVGLSSQAVATKAVNDGFGSTTDLTAPKSDFRFTPDIVSKVFLG